MSLTISSVATLKQSVSTVLQTPLSHCKLMGKKSYWAARASRDDVISGLHYEKLASKPAALPGGKLQLTI